MSNDLVSLDDIIKKNKTSTAMRNNRGAKKAPATVRGNKANGTASIRTNKIGPLRTGAIKKSMEDARFKIIQKKRVHIADARDKLAQIAKQSDARLKLQKIRATNPKKNDSTNIRKRERNGRISGSSSKLPPMHMPRALPSAYMPPPSRSISFHPPPLPQHPFVNELFLNYRDDYLMNQAALRRTVSNDYMPALPPPPPVLSIKPISYGWDKLPQNSTRSQSLRSSERPRDYKVIPRTGMHKTSADSVFKNLWDHGPKTRSISPDSSLQFKFYPTKNHRDGVKSRLDSPPSKSNRLAASSSRPKSSSQSTGYRIIVQNLQANVTQEDIKELFEDVGELLVSRLVKPGVAEVIYKTLKDATKAVETYHNRQLDGHPMKCLLVNSKSKTSSSTTSSGRVLSQSRNSSSYGQSSLGFGHRSTLFN